MTGNEAIEAIEEYINTSLCVKGEIEYRAREAIKVLKEPEWIPIEKKLPNWGEYTWICIDGNIFIDWFAGDHWNKHPDADVTHWQPIPRPKGVEAL